MTINEVMALQKAVRDRVAALKALRAQVATKERYWNVGVEQKTVEPQYDIKLVDKKIMLLENFLFRADAAVKQTNAKTEVDGLGYVNFEELLAPLEQDTTWASISDWLVQKAGFHTRKGNGEMFQSVKYTCANAHWQGDVDGDQYKLNVVGCCPA